MFAEQRLNSMQKLEAIFLLSFFCLQGANKQCLFFFFEVKCTISIFLIKMLFSTLNKISVGYCLLGKLVDSFLMKFLEFSLKSLFLLVIQFIINSSWHLVYIEFFLVSRAKLDFWHFNLKVIMTKEWSAWDVPGNVWEPCLALADIISTHMPSTWTQSIL